MCFRLVDTATSSSGSSHYIKVTYPNYPLNLYKLGFPKECYINLSNSIFLNSDVEHLNTIAERIFDNYTFPYQIPMIIELDKNRYPKNPSIYIYHTNTGEIACIQKTHDISYINNGDNEIPINVKYTLMDKKDLDDLIAKEQLFNLNSVFSNADLCTFVKRRNYNGIKCFFNKFKYQLSTFFKGIRYKDGGRGE